MKKQSKILIIIAGGILLAATIAITTVLMVSGSDGRKYQKHMEAAQQYLDELQYEQAIAEYELAIEIEPNNIEAYHALAELYGQMEDYDSAVAVLNRGIEQTESEDLADDLEKVQTDWGMKYQKHMEAAQQYLDELQYEQAIAEYELAIEIDPNDARAYKKLAELYVQMEDYESAIAELNRGIEQTESEELADHLEEVQTDWEEKQTQSAPAQVSQAQTQEVPQEETQEDLQKSVFYDGSREETVYMEDGSYKIDVYDGSGNRVKVTYYHADGTLSSIDEYDENGNRVMTSEYAADGTLFMIWEYNANGNIEKGSFYNEDGTLGSVIEHDVNGNIEKWSFYNTDETLSSYDIYEYDENGNRIKDSWYKGDGTLIYYIIYEYDGNGNCVKETYYHAN